MRILLALLLVLVLAGPVDAILVDGTIFTGLGNDYAPNMILRGEDFSLQSVGPSGNPLSGFSGVFSSTVLTDVSNTSRIQSPASVTYQGQAFPFTTVTGPLTFDVEPFFFRADSPGIPGVAPPTFVGDSPFTMTGQLSFDGHTVTLEGSGVLTVNAVATLPLPPGSSLIVNTLAYNFTPIPEPGTLLLFGTAAGLGALYGLRKRRGDR